MIRNKVRTQRQEGKDGNLTQFDISEEILVNFLPPVLLIVEMKEEDPPPSLQHLRVLASV